LIPDRIEHDVLIEAPVDTVWRIITEPEHIAQWFSDAAEVDLRPGGVGTLIFGDPSSTETKSQPFFIETFDPTSHFSFRWCHEDSNDRSTKSLLVEFTLEPEGSDTRLRLVESNHSARWGEEGYDDHVKGWNVIVPRLVEHAEMQA